MKLIQWHPKYNMVSTHCHNCIVLSLKEKSDVLENVNPDLSDSEFIERADTMDAQTPHPGSDVGDAPTPGAGAGEDGDGDEEDGEGDFDAELAAELNAELNAALIEEVDEEDADDEDEDGSDEDEDEEDDDDEAVQSKRLLNEEIRDLEAAVRRKEIDIANSANPLIKVRIFFFHSHFSPLINHHTLL